MKNFIKGLLGQRRNGRVTVAALLTAGAVAGWALSAFFTANATAREDLSGIDVMVQADLKKPAEELKPSLIGSYVVTGTHPSGEPYAGAGALDIVLGTSGALELVWDNGKSVGVGQVIGNVLAVASSTRGRTVILMMNINPDGSLSGTSSRRTDRGSKGTEAWKRT